MSLPEFEVNELVSFDVIAETLGTSRLRVERLVRLGLLDVVDNETGERMVPRLTVIRLRRMHRLRRDLGVNFTGASIIVDLVDRIEQLNRELTEMQRKHAQ